ncbi:prolyl oligopeptidase family serine peptidase [Lentzea sp. HUAS12]|uniref:S9 family peptidase n=1 Tax=Lentzea sp. HUAS12 TaxID=2951806 RepID=UPI00209E85DD|nr:prolyl oligopeptidase family serine peptidase [Lentzea sp. HUAS12]USX52821.1 prolyl oligopeptidase family serine peptidase [Lentzea sp. HUAS12]
MEDDVRYNATWRRVSEFFTLAHSPGSIRASDFTEVSGRASRQDVVATATVCDSFDEPLRRVVVRIRNGEISLVSDGKSDARAASWSADGAWIAYLAAKDPDRGHHVLHVEGLHGHQQILLPGVAEQYAWAPSGHSILVQVADPGADKAGAEGSGQRPGGAGSVRWLPAVDTATSKAPGRSLWLVNSAKGTSRRVPTDRTVWEAGWAGPNRAVVVESDGATESDWYVAHLSVVDLVTGATTELHRGGRQLGRPAGSPNGRWVAVVEADCSDRDVIAGELLLFDRAGRMRVVDTLQVEVSSVRWLDDRRISFAGVRGLHSVVGVHNVVSGRSKELWATESGLGGVHRADAYVRPDETVVAAVQGYRRPPSIVRRSASGNDVLATAADGRTEVLLDRIGNCVPISWEARDGERIEGLYVTPDGPGPHPLVVFLHGGPVFGFRPRWLGHTPLVALLASHGYAVLCPNPRGSSGRGAKFTAAVFEDVGGVGGGDVLAGVDHLVGLGVVDPDRIGVTGSCYGGYLASWLVTQDDRFKAAATISPVTHWRTIYSSSNIPRFVTNVLRAKPGPAGDLYDARSPLTHVASVRTPCLNIAGALDLCTPASEARQFHRALLDHGVESALVVYPAEGHGIRAFPAVIDQCTRVLDWFGRFMPAR